MLSAETRSAENQKTLRLGLLLGNVAGLLLLCGGLPFSRRFLENAFPYSASGYYVGDLAVCLSLALGAFIFPAVLSGLAKHFYALWGLLPIFLLMLWLAAGCLSAHRLSSLVDPPWLVPVAAALCWAIASFPVSAFRFLRRRYMRAAAPAFNPAAKPVLNRVWKRVCFLVPLTLLLSVGVLGWYNLNHPKHFNIVMQPHWLPGKEAVVPLVKEGNGLYVKAWLNNQEVLCQVDTGSESVEWSRGLHVEGRRTSRHGQVCDLLGGCVAAQAVVLPRLRIGNYEITNIPTDMSDADSGLFTPALRAGNQSPLLGNTAFVGTVLTVDYKNAQLIIRPPQYDFSRRTRKPGDRVLDMGWASPYPNKTWRWSLYGTPAVEASLGGALFWCTLDTGADGPEICLTKTLVDRNAFIERKRHGVAPLNAASSSAQVERLDNLNVEFPCSVPSNVLPVTFTLNGLVTPTLKSDPPAGMGVIGLPLMQRYRITIDYGRGRVLLEPYPEHRASRKQEKGRLVPKQPGI